MRPTKLSIQGLTAYRGNIEVDFSELDLFAITGETGSGKSSLVDAISFALFGQAPRVGSKVRELISQGEDRLKVSLEFRSDGDKYRIHRETGRKGQKPPQIERWDGKQDDWQPEEPDRVRDANAFIERLLQMDYEAFVRSVLLPQGQFQEFLAGDRDERRKVLDRLLDLDVYRRMEARANALARESEREAERIAERLRDELGEATPEALRAARAELKSLQQRSKEMAATCHAIEASARIAEELAKERSRHESGVRAQADADKRLVHARDLLAGGQKTLDKLDAEVAEQQAQVKATDYDADLHLRLSRCVPLLREIERAKENESNLAAEVTKGGPELKKLETDEASARRKDEAAHVSMQSAHKAFEEAQHLNAATVLVSGLNAGDPCPVCGERLASVPQFERSNEFEARKASWQKAQAAERAAREALAQAEKRLEVGRQSLAGLHDRLDSAKAEGAARVAELRAALPDPKLDPAAIETRVKALDSAKSRLDQLNERAKAAVANRDKMASEISVAKTDVTRLETEANAQTAEVAATSKQLAVLEAALRNAAGELAWADVTDALDRGRDAVPLLRLRLTAAQDDERNANQQIGAAGKHIDQIAANIELAKKLRGEEKTHRKAGLLAKDLASLLRIDALPSFIREEALRRLAKDGSHRLQEISGGRYEFAVDGQDFLIVDRWNGGDSRSVRTLSGGETFLASLALALALAEQLPALGGHTAGSSLESLFIDEGFSHLDAETLDVVASALEVLGEDRRRLIGVITHVPALAERMPARITVHKSQTGSTVTVE